MAEAIIFRLARRQQQTDTPSQTSLITLPTYWLPLAWVTASSTVWNYQA